MNINPFNLSVLVLLFIIITAVCFFIITKISNRHFDERLKMINASTHSEMDESFEHPLMRKFEKSFAFLTKWSMPKESWETSINRVLFLNAGFRSRFSVVIFFGSKTLLTLFLPFLYLFLHTIFTPFLYSFFQVSVVCCVLAIFGYYFPNFVLHQMVRLRKRELFENIPDALDLIRVCVSAGLGLEGAIARVGDELVVKSKALAEEFHILNLELRAGVSRESALHNLAVRTGVEDINALVAMLIQSDRFGTSVTESLRVHADLLRGRRKMLAQEAAAKIAVKLTIPMILCIFPALFVVILGPAVLNVLHSLAGHFN